MNTHRINRKNILFFTYYTIIIFLIAFPGPFDWANRVEPWVMGLPFSIFYLLLMTSLLVLGTIVQYIIEDRSGELDITVVSDTDKNNGFVRGKW